MTFFGQENIVELATKLNTNKIYYKCRHQQYELKTPFVKNVSDKKMFNPCIDSFSLNTSSRITWMKLIKTSKMAIDLSNLLYEMFPTVTMSFDSTLIVLSMEVL